MPKLLTGCLYLLCNSACGESTNDPLKIQNLERDEDETGVVIQVLGALRVQEMMSRSGTDVFLVALGERLVHPAKRCSFMTQEKHFLTDKNTIIQGSKSGNLGFFRFSNVELNNS